MITFPPEYVKIHYPGYFWNIKTQKLYSIKSGTLKALTLQTGGWYYKDGTKIPPHYQVSVKGIKKPVHLNFLTKIQLPTNNEIVDIA